MLIVEPQHYLANTETKCSISHNVHYLRLFLKMYTSITIAQHFLEAHVTGLCSRLPLRPDWGVFDFANNGGFEFFLKCFRKRTISDESTMSIVFTFKGIQELHTTWTEKEHDCEQRPLYYLGFYSVLANLIS